MLSQYGSVVKKAIYAVLVVVAGMAIFYGAVALAAHIPTVTITDPGSGDDVSGVIGVSCDYAVSSGNVHSLYMIIGGVQADSVELHSSAGSYTFNIDTTEYPDGSLDITIEAYSAAKPSGHFSDDTIIVNVANAVCDDDSDCDDSDDYTEDTCESPGAPDAVCVNDPIECLNDSDCDDNDPDTTESCTNPGSSEAECTYSFIYCKSDVGCDDGDPSTADICLEPGTPESRCEFIPIACLGDEECDDSDDYTADTCENAGTVDAACIHNAISCISDDDCDDANPLSTDTCIDSGTVDAECSNVECPVACGDDADCDDGDPLTIDSCIDAGTCESECENASTVCNVNSDCDDSDAFTIDVCLDGGTESAQCLNTVIACNTDEDCDDNDSTTEDTCINSRTESAACINELIPEEPVELMLDVTAPADGTITNVSTIEIEGITASGADITINGTDIINTDGAFSEPVLLDEGGNTIAIIAILDSDTLTETINVTLDTIAPSVITTDPADGAELEITPDLISIRIEDNIGGTGLDVSTIYASLDAAELSGNWNAGANTYEATGIEVDPGYHTLTVTAADNAGNQLMETITFVKQGKGPKVKILSVPGTPGVTSIDATSVLIDQTEQPDSENVESDEETVQEETYTVTDLTATGDWLSNIRKYNPDHPLAQLIRKVIKPQKRPNWSDMLIADSEEAGVPEYEPVVIEASSQDDVAVIEMMVEGEVTAEIIEESLPIDEDTIEVKVDGKVIPHEYDKETKKIKCKAKDLKLGIHSATVTVLDTDGNEGTATLAFGIDPIITSLTLINLTDYEKTSIAQEDPFEIIMTMLDDDGENPATGFTNVWAVLYNGDTQQQKYGWIGYEYSLSETSIPGEYMGSGIFYKSTDNSGSEASCVYAAVPLSADISTTEYEFSDNCLTVEDPPVAPWIDNVALSNITTGENSISEGDEYSLTGSGTPGIQALYGMLLSVDSMTTGDFTLMTVEQSGSASEISSGSYQLDDAKTLETLLDGAGIVPHALLPLLCENTGISCGIGSVVYVGDVPEIVSVTLENASNPGNPLLRGDTYRVTVEGDPGTHLPHMIFSLANADRIDGWAPWSGGDDHPFVTDVYPEVTWVNDQTGIYYYEGQLENATDGSGETATQLVAVVTLSNYAEQSISNSYTVDWDQTPSSLWDATLTNASYPELTTILPGEVFRASVGADEGYDIQCVVMAQAFDAPEGTHCDEPVVVYTESMNYDSGSGLYSCESTIDTIPDIQLYDGDDPVGTMPVEFLEVIFMAGGEQVGMSDDLLTFRANITEVHFSKVSDPSATEIAEGEEFEITVDGESEIEDLYVFVIDRRVNTYHPEGQDGPTIVYQSADPITEESSGSGHYVHTANLPGVSLGIEELRGFAAAMDENGNFITGTKPVLSTEILDVDRAVIPPPDMQSIGGEDVGEDGYVESSEESPVVAGTAPADSQVTIYEFFEGESAGTLGFVPDGPELYAEYTSSGGTYADYFDDGVWDDRWGIGSSGDEFSINESDDHMTISMGANTGVTFYGQGYSGVPQDEFAAQIVIPFDGNTSVDEINGSFMIRFGNERPDTTENYYSISVALGESPGEMKVYLQGEASQQCSDTMGSYSLGESYRVSLTFTDNPPQMHGSVNGNEIVACELTYLPDGDVNLTQMWADNYSSTTPMVIEVYSYETGIPVAPVYVLSGPALYDENGTTYDGLGNYGLLSSPCVEGDGPGPLPAEDGCVTGENDIYAFLVTAYNVMLDESSPLVPELKVTFYSAGGDGYSPEGFVRLFLDGAVSGGVFDSYSMDASVVVLNAQGSGLSYLPSDTLAVQEELCTYTEGPDGFLTLDPDTGDYLASYTPLVYEDITYDGLVFWGLDEYDNPLVILPGEESIPVWWANGNEAIWVALGYYDEFGYLTVYGTEAFIGSIPSAVRIDVVVEGILTPSVDAITGEKVYTWQDGALPSEITVAPEQSCVAGMFEPVSDTVDAVDGVFSVETYPLSIGEHTLVAKAEATTGTLTSEAVTYNYVDSIPTDTTPPVITFTSHTEGELISTGRPVIEATITDNAQDDTGVDWNSVTCESSVTCEIERIEGTDNAVISFSGWLPDGENSITITAFDNAVNTASAVITLNVDTTSPDIKDSDIFIDPTSFNNTNDNSTTITATVTDDNLDAWWVQINDESGAVYIFDPVTDNTASFTWNGTDIDGNAAPEGSYTIIITAMDLVENDSYNDSHDVTIDNTPPDITFINPLSGDRTGAFESYYSNFTITDPLGVDDKAVYLDDVLQYNPIENYEGDNYRIELDLSVLEGKEHTLTVYACDSIGNCTSESVDIELIRDNATITDIELSNFTRSTTDDISLGEVFLLSIDVLRAFSTPQYKIVNADEYLSGNDSYDIAVDYDLLNSVGDKSFKFYGRITTLTDKAGRSVNNVMALASTDGFVTVVESSSLPVADTMIPAAPIITDPRDGGTTNDDTPFIRGEIESGMTAHVYLSLAEGDILIGSSLDNFDGIFRIPDSESLAPAGEKTIYAVAENPLTGLISDPSPAITFTLDDFTPPLITEYSVSPDPFSQTAYIEDKRTTTFNATIYDEQLDWIRLVIRDEDGQKYLVVDEYPENPDPTGPNSFSYTWDGNRNKPVSQTGTPAPEGTYNYHITAWDESRNQSETAEGFITIDLTPPTVSIESPDNNVQVSGAAQSIILTASDNIEVDSVAIYIDSVGPAAHSIAQYDETTGQYTAWINPAGVPATGDYSIIAAAFDTAGNISETDEITAHIEAVPDNAAYIAHFLQDNVERILHENGVFTISNAETQANPVRAIYNTATGYINVVAPGSGKLLWLAKTFSPDLELTLAIEKDAGDMPSEMVLSPDGSLIYVSASLSGEVIAFDASTGDEVFRVEPGFIPNGLALSTDGGTLYVALKGEDSIAVLDAATGSPLSDPILLTPNSRPHALASYPINPDILTYSASMGGYITSIDTSASPPAVVGTLDTGLTPSDILFDPTGQYLIVACRDSHSVQVFDLSTGEITNSFTIRSPYRLDLSPDGSLVYIRSSAWSRLHYLDLNTMTISEVE